MKFPSRQVADPLCQRNWEFASQLDPLVTSLPKNPYDGQTVTYIGANDANGSMPWRLRYRATSGGTYKWEFVGGSPIYMFYGAQFTTTSTSMVEYTPRLTMPLAGLYEYTMGARPFHVNGQGVNTAVGLLRAGVYTGVLIDSYQGSSGIATTLFAANQVFTGRTNESAGSTFSLGLSTPGGTAYVSNSWLRIQPIAVG